MLVQAFEKVYWTLDPTLQTWNEGDWTPAGYVWYKIDFDDVKYSWSNGSLHIFPTNVDYVIATVSEGKAPPSNETGPYIVRVLLYAKNLNGNTGVHRGPWIPCDKGVFLHAFSRPNPGKYERVWILSPELKEHVRKLRAQQKDPLRAIPGYVSKRGVYRESFSASFPAVVGNGTVKLDALLDASFEVDYAYLTLAVSISSGGWSKAPPDAELLVVYACDESLTALHAKYEP